MIQVYRCGCIDPACRCCKRVDIFAHQFTQDFDYSIKCVPEQIAAPGPPPDGACPYCRACCWPVKGKPPKRGYPAITKASSKSARSVERNTTFAKIRERLKAAYPNAMAICEFPEYLSPNPNTREQFRRRISDLVDRGECAWVDSDNPDAEARNPITNRDNTRVIWVPHFKGPPSPSDSPARAALWEQHDNYLGLEDVALADKRLAKFHRRRVMGEIHELDEKEANETQTGTASA